jgi:small-conductance mechanosensitive channel
MEFFGVRLVGFNAENAHKLALSVALIVIVVAVRKVVLWITARLFTAHPLGRARFWTHQILDVIVAITLVLGLLSLWFDDPRRLTTAVGLVTAGLAFALQKVVTAIAGYLILVRGKVFSVGDRIVMGGVRGDVIDMTFTQTRIMEMGEPPPVQEAEPPTWVHSRQYTGRIVSVSNARIFDEPVYNYTREFPYLWEELRLPISYSADRARVERLLLDVANRHTAELQKMGEDARRELMRRYILETTDLAPRVYVRLTDNWLELAVRFVAREHGVRALKDAMSREILDGLERLGVTIASATYEIVGLPEVHVALGGRPSSS